MIAGDLHINIGSLIEETEFSVILLPSKSHAFVQAEIVCEFLKMLSILAITDHNISQ